MSEKRHALPQWMATEGEKSKEIKATVRRKRLKKARSIFYCMNERELVESAVSLLANAADCPPAALLAGHKVEGKTRNSTSRENPVTQESSECSEAEEAAHVSETDVDVSEMETLPYATSPTHQEPSGQTSEPLQARAASGSAGLEVDRKEDEKEEDPLRLVREIFFS